ncbi:MAG: AAA family ATPase, partial [Oscillospiraceae bacterium]|nr:AAA family ATPase [Oscillospiraceae bacterium]
MAKLKTVYICSQCGYESSKWNGKCPSCGEWNTFEEDVVEVQTSKSSLSKSGTSSIKTVNLSSKIVTLAGIDAEEDVRYSTGINELNRVLGGGLVKGSLVLLGGEPGIGKSTLLLQICKYLGENYTILYISGEESVRQIKIRAQRLGVDTENLSLLSTNDARAAADTISVHKPDIAIIDSIQTMSLSEINSSSGSITQVRE